MTPSELKKHLLAHGIRPLKARGQHFLLDDGVVEKMLVASGVKKGDAVLEIGPGPGILTEALLGVGADLVAVELDRKLCTLLEERFKEDEVTILQGDILSFSMEELVICFNNPEEAMDSGYRVVANLPYSITSKIIEKILQELPYPKSATLMIQKEVADRIVAKQGKMTALSVFVQTMADVSRVIYVPRGAFYPPPKVDSAVIHIVRKEGSDKDLFGGVSAKHYFSLVRRGFSSPRKKLVNTISGTFFSRDECEKAFNKAKLALSVRPSEVRIDQWKILASAMREVMKK